MAIICCPGCGMRIEDTSNDCPNCHCPPLRLIIHEKQVMKKFGEDYDEWSAKQNNDKINQDRIADNNSEPDSNPDTNKVFNANSNFGRIEVNPLSESVGQTVAQCFLWFSIIIGSICIITGLSLGEDILLLTICGVLIAFSGLLSWAVIKILVNISRSLYDINDALREKKE